MITVSNLTKTYNQVKVLDNVSTHMAKGHIIGIIGSNGAGKSTLISIIAGIVKPTTGSVTTGQAKIGYVPQEITLFPSLTVRENLNFWDAISTSHKGKSRKENIKRIIQIAQLEDYLHKRVDQLSGGLKRRLNIAVSLLPNPDILIMDEPTVGMDVHSRTEMVTFIKGLACGGTTILYVSHHPDEIDRLCHDIICLNQGHLVFDGSLSSLKARYLGDTIHDIIYKISSSTAWSEGGSHETPHTD